MASDVKSFARLNVPAGTWRRYQIGIAAGCVAKVTVSFVWNVPAQAMAPLMVKYGVPVAGFRGA